MCEYKPHMCNHFSKVAEVYREVRTTDVAPILFIKDKLRNKRNIKAVDIGCGAGRYDLLLFQHLPNLHLTCVDSSKAMLEKASEYLKRNGISKFNTVHSDIDRLSLKKYSLDCIFTFNTIHHFEFVRFLRKSVRALKKDGLIFIYTRLRSQNKKNIWGKYFPMFIEKENRLYELDEMKRWINSVDSIKLESTEYFKYKRLSALKNLLHQANSKHYSTFCLYTKEEFEKALKGFEENITKNYGDITKVEWHDENILLVLEVIAKSR